MFARLHCLSTKGRVLTAILINAGLLTVVCYAFWFADWQYSLPTPKPEGLVQAPLGSRPELPAAIAAFRREHRPLLINFANAQCPCTEFNLDHLRKLQRMFGDRADFVLVLETSADTAGARAEFASMHLNMPVVYDHEDQASAALGVYGTPQAAILDADQRLYFRGNYNQSRYCTEESSEYVRIAMTSLLAGRALPGLSPLASITYGCPLPHRFRIESAGSAATRASP